MSKAILCVLARRARLANQTHQAAPLLSSFCSNAHLAVGLKSDGEKDSHSGWSWPFGSRMLNTGGLANNSFLAIDILKQVGVHKLRQELVAESDKLLHIPLSRFTELAMSSGAAQNEEQAEAVCQLLHQAGVVIRNQNTVYLRGEEVSQMIMLMLPGEREDVEKKLALVEAELAELDKVHDQVEQSSTRLSNVLLTLGLAILSTQFVAFIYLTWWELSWDVMEPIAYIISLFYSIVAYVYFMFMRHAFDLGPFQDFWAKRFKLKRISAIQFDARRWEYLTRLRARYQRHLSFTAEGPKQ